MEKWLSDHFCYWDRAALKVESSNQIAEA